MYDIMTMSAMMTSDYMEMYCIKREYEYINAFFSLSNNALSLTFAGRWWREWCHYVGVRAVYDASQYCVVDLQDASRAEDDEREEGRGGQVGARSVSAVYSTEVFTSSPASSTSLPSPTMAFAPSVPLFFLDMVKRPGAIRNNLLQVSAVI